MWRERCAERKRRECAVPASCGRDAGPGPAQARETGGRVSLPGAGAEPAPQEPARATPPKKDPAASPGAEPLGGTCLSRCRRGPYLARGGASRRPVHPLVEPPLRLVILELVEPDLLVRQEVRGHLPAGGEREAAAAWPAPAPLPTAQAPPVLGWVTRAPGQSTGGSRPRRGARKHPRFPPHTVGAQACPQDQRPSKCSQEPLGVPQVLPSPSTHLCKAGSMPDNTQKRGSEPTASHQAHPRLLTCRTRPLTR